MYGSPTDTTILDGFTITNGNSPVGGGLHTDGSPQILNCRFVNNIAKIGGGIFHLENGTAGPAISNTYFCDNDPEDIYGSWIDGGGNIFGDDCGSDCPADISGDGWVNVTDLLAVISAWGPCEGCEEDINGSGIVDIADLLTIIGNWGPCE